MIGVEGITPTNPFLLTVPLMAIRIPEENRCLDILELNERHDLLEFVKNKLSLCNR